MHCYFVFSAHALSKQLSKEQYCESLGNCTYQNLLNNKDLLSVQIPMAAYIVCRQYRLKIRTFRDCLSRNN